VKQGLDVLEQTGNFIPECTAFQKSVQDTTNGAMAEIIEGAVDALDALSSGLPLNGGFPKDFYSGAGGALDKARSDVKRQVDQLYKSISGRLRKTVKVLEQNDASLTVDLRPPRYHDDHRFSEDGSAVFINRYGLDLVVAVNRTALAEDGRLWTGGTAYSALGEVSVLVTGPESDSGTAPVSSARWALFLTDAGSFFVNGNYSLSVTAESDIGGVGVPFSFR
jgi:hypothetical protein